MEKQHEKDRTARNLAVVFFRVSLRIEAKLGLDANTLFAALLGEIKAAMT